MRKILKVHENTYGIKIIYDLIKKQIVHTDDKYKTFYLTKFSVENIIYDDQMICCFYDDSLHPMASTLGKSVITMAKMFAQEGLTVILSHTKDQFVHILIFPKHQVKIFHEGVK